MQKILGILILFHILYCPSLFSQNRKNLENSNYGATIEKNLEAYTLLERAQIFLQSKKYQDAVLLLKVISEKYPYSLITTEDKFYIPFREKISELINSLPREAKELFLLEINYISSGLYKKAMEEMDVLILEEIFQKYYISELGDDASYHLGLIAFEKGHYIKAMHYFEKSINHPNCSLNTDKIRLCLYYLYKITKNEKNAQALYSQLKAIPALKEKLMLTDLAIAEWQKLGQNSLEGGTEFQGIDKEFWTTVWKQEYELNFTSLSYDYNSNQRINRRNRKSSNAENEVFFDEDSLINDWKKNLWFPVNNSVTNETCIIFRKNDHIMCFALDNMKKILWEANVEGSNKNIFKGNFPEDPYNNRDTRIPTTRDEVLAFSDQIGKQMVIHKGVLFAVSNHEKTGVILPYYQKRWGNNLGNTKYEGNLIFAIDVKSGKKIWKLGENSNADDPFYNAIFLHLPIETPYGYLVTFRLNSDIYSATVTKQNREIIWKKYLCSAESTTEMPTNNAAVVYGDDFIFITIDYGVVIKINASNGNFCWIKRYNSTTSGRLDSYTIPTIKDGIELNSLVYHFGRLIIFPSDANTILIVDSESGDELYTIDDGFVDFRRYLIGTDDSGFYMAGSKGIRKYQYDSNQFVWQSAISENYGKGILFGKNILFPSNRNLYIIDKETGKTVSTLKIKLENPNAPLGNISVSNGFIISTNYNSVTIVNEVELIIKNLTEIIIKNKTDEIIHQRGVLYFEIGEYQKSFEDIAEAITMAGSNIQKNIVYCDSLLNLFEKIHNLGQEKKYQSAILEMSKFISDSNHKSFLNFLHGEINAENKKYDEALKNYIESFSQKNSDSKNRMVQNKLGYSTPSFAALLKVAALLENNLISEDKLIELLNQSENIPEEFILLALIEKCHNEKIKQWVFNAFVKKSNNDLISAKINSFLHCLMHIDDPIVSLSARYYLFLQLIQMQEYWSAGKELEILRNQNTNTIIYTENGPELLTSKISKFKSNTRLLMDDMIDPALRQITDPPLKEIWSTSKNIGPQTRLIYLRGFSPRPEFVEKNIFLHNMNENKIFGCDLLTGEKKWTFEVPISKRGSNKFGESENSNLILFRMEGIGVLNNDYKNYAIDLKTGKNIWTIDTDKSIVFDIGSGCLLNYKSNKLNEINELKELSVIDAFNGKKMYSISLKEEIKKAFAHKGRLILLNLSNTTLSIYNLYTGEKIKDINFNHSLQDSVNLLLENMIVLQKINGEVMAFSLKDGELVWENKLHGTGSCAYDIFNINDDKILMNCQNNKVYYLSSKNGEIVWNFVIPDRFLYNKIEVHPVSGNETFIILGWTQSKQIKENSSSQDHYFIFDMATGNLLNKVVMNLASQDYSRNRSLGNIAFKGDVIPKISATNNNGVLINFVRKRDGGVVKKHFIELRYNYEFEFISAKGSILFTTAQNDVIFYGNPAEIKSQNQKINLLKVAFDEK